MAGGGVNLTRRFQIFLTLLNVYTYSFKTSLLFLNIENKNFEKNLILIVLPPTPLEEGELKMTFVSQKLSGLRQFS